MIKFRKYRISILVFLAVFTGIMTVGCQMGNNGAVIETMADSGVVEEEAEQQEETGQKEETGQREEDGLTDDKDKTENAPVRILFIGNSITRRIGDKLEEAEKNYFIEEFREVLHANGKKAAVQCAAEPDKTLQDMIYKNTNLGYHVFQRIENRRWDYIVIQPNTDSEIAQPEIIKSGINYLSKEIHEKSADCQIVIDATFPYYEEKKELKEKFGGGTFSLEEQLKNIDNNAREAAEQEEVSGIVGYTGDAFIKYMQETDYKDLYLEDNNHPTAAGQYFKALCMYHTIFGEIPDTSYINPNVTEEQAKAMVSIIESLDTDK